MADGQHLTGALKRARQVAAPVVAQDPRRIKPRDGARQKGRGGVAALTRPDLHKCHARRVVDGDMDVFPPRTPIANPSIAVNPMADPRDAAERLDVQVQQVARVELAAVMQLQE